MLAALNLRTSFWACRFIAARSATGLRLGCSCFLYTEIGATAADSCLDSTPQTGLLSSNPWASSLRVELSLIDERYAGEIERWRDDIHNLVLVRREQSRVLPCVVRAVLLGVADKCFLVCAYPGVANFKIVGW